jgi:GNAT superfamily N-acetyltransferase
VQLRPVRADELVRLDEVRLSVWRSAYRGLVPDAFLDGLAITEEMTAVRRSWLDDPDHPMHVAVDGGEVVGIAVAGPPRDDDLDADGWTELGALYVLPERWGAGTGRALLEAVLARRPRSHQALWVLEGNDRSRAFYASCGFRPDGAHKVEVLHGPVAEVRLVRP